METRRNKPAVKKTLRRGDELRGEHQIGQYGTSLRLEAVNHLGVEKGSGSGAQPVAAAARQYSDGSLQNIEYLHLRVPMPVHAVEIKFPDILHIVAQGKLRVSMMGNLLHGFIRKNSRI